MLSEVVKQVSVVKLCCANWCLRAIPSPFYLPVSVTENFSLGHLQNEVLEETSEQKMESLGYYISGHSSKTQGHCNFLANGVFL